MAVTYTWTIPTVERNLSDGGITIIHWRCTGVDGDYSSSNYGTTSHTQMLMLPTSLHMTM